MNCLKRKNKESEIILMLAALSTIAPLAKMLFSTVDKAIPDKDLAEKFGVKGFPTLKFFREGEVGEYNGGRTEATIISWL